MDFFRLIGRNVLAIRDSDDDNSLVGETEGGRSAAEVDLSCESSAAIDLTIDDDSSSSDDDGGDQVSCLARKEIIGRVDSNGCVPDTSTDHSSSSCARRRTRHVEETSRDIYGKSLLVPPSGRKRRRVESPGTPDEVTSIRPHQPLPYSCNSRLPAFPPDLDDNNEWIPCCEIHRSWYKPLRRFVDTYGYKRCNSNRVRGRWHTHCRLCGANVDPGKKAELPYKPPGAPAAQGPSNLNFCSSICRDEMKIRLDGYAVRDRVLRRDGGECADCGKICRGNEWEAAHVHAIKDGGGCCGLSNYKTLCKECHRKETYYS